MIPVLVTAIAAVVWVPLIWTQAARWRQRRAPESLAIVSAMTVLAFVAVLLVWGSWLSDGIAAVSKIFVVSSSLVTGIHFHWAFWRGAQHPSRLGSSRGQVPLQVKGDQS